MDRQLQLTGAEAECDASLLIHPLSICGEPEE